MKLKRQTVCVFKHVIHNNGWIEPKGECVKSYGPYGGYEANAYANRLNARARHYWHYVYYVDRHGELIAI